jgi:hypothetical protein
MPPRREAEIPADPDDLRAFARSLHATVDEVLTLYPRILDSPFLRSDDAQQEIDSIRRLANAIRAPQLLTDTRLSRCVASLLRRYAQIAETVADVFSQLPTMLRDLPWSGMLHTAFNDRDPKYWEGYTTRREAALASLRDHRRLHKVIADIARQGPGGQMRIRALPDVTELMHGLEAQADLGRDQQSRIANAMDIDTPAHLTVETVEAPALSGMATDIPTHPELERYATWLLERHTHVESLIDSVLRFDKGERSVGLPRRIIAREWTDSTAGTIGHLRADADSLRFALTRALRRGNHQHVLLAARTLAIHQRRMRLLIPRWWESRTTAQPWAGAGSPTYGALGNAVDAVLDELDLIQHTPLPEFLADLWRWDWYLGRLADVPAQEVRRKITELLQAPGMFGIWEPPPGLDTAILAFEARPTSYPAAKELHQLYAELVERLVQCLWECEAGCQQWHQAQPAVPWHDAQGSQRFAALRELVDTTVWAVEAAEFLIETLCPVLAEAPEELGWGAPKAPDPMNVIYAVRSLVPADSTLQNPAWQDVTEAS